MTNRPQIIRRSRGLSLPEVLISLAITAMLLTAVAAAFSASASAIEVNDRFFRASQAARISLAQICYVFRRSESCAIPAWDNVSSSTSGSQINLHYYDAIVGAGTLQDISYKFDSATNQLQLINNLTGTTNVLAHNISALTFTADMVADPQSQSGAKTAANITIDITITINQESVHIRGSAQPRRLVVYK